MTCAIRMYQENGCIVLCEAWVARLEFFYRLWLAREGETNYRFTPADIESFIEEPGIAASQESCNDETRERLHIIRGLHP